MTTTQAIDWDLTLLKQNPFPDTPPRKPAEAVWAGMPRLKAQFEGLFAEALTTSATQVVLNWGAYGSGKTHAAVYFGDPSRFPKLQGEQVKDVWVIHVHTPGDPSQADAIFYRDVLEKTRFGRLRQVIRDIIATYGQADALAMLQDLAESEPLGRALWLLGMEGSSSGQLQLLGEKTDSDERQQMLQAYFFSQHTKGDLKKLGLSRGIDSSADRFRLLGAALQCMIGLAPKEGMAQHTRVLLWIDEMEDLIYFTSRQYRPFTQGLRDMIDRLPNYFTVLLNFTLAAPEAYEDATVVLGQALMDRVTQQIYFQEPGEGEAFEYVTDLLRIFRREDPASRGLPVTYPFSEDALRAIVTMLPSRTPRDLNQRCSDVITKALQRRIITGPGNGTISVDFITQLDKERTDLEMRS